MSKLKKSFEAWSNIHPLSYVLNVFYSVLLNIIYILGLNLKYYKWEFCLHQLDSFADEEINSL